MWCSYLIVPHITPIVNPAEICDILPDEFDNILSKHSTIVITHTFHPCHSAKDQMMNTCFSQLLNDCNHLSGFAKRSWKTAFWLISIDTYGRNLRHWSTSASERPRLPLQNTLWMPANFTHVGQWATTLVTVLNTRVFRTALTAGTEPRTLWWSMRRDPLHMQRVALHTSLAAANVPCLWFLQRIGLFNTLAAPASCCLHFASGMWWCMCTIRTTCMLHSSHWLQLGSSHLQKAWPCLCLASANSHMLHSHLCLVLRFCNVFSVSNGFGWPASGLGLDL